MTQRLKQRFRRCLARQFRRASACVRSRQIILRILFIHPVTTGKPERAAIPHQNVVTLITGCFDLYDFTSDDVWTLFHSYAFDFTIWEIWGAFITGAKLVLISDLARKSFHDFRKVLARYGVTVLSQTPSSFYQLMEVEKEISKFSVPLSIRYVVFGGEALRSEEATGLASRHYSF